MFTVLLVLLVGIISIALINVSYYLEKKKLYNEEKSELYKKAVEKRKNIKHENSFNEYFGIGDDK